MCDYKLFFLSQTHLRKIMLCSFLVEWSLKSCHFPFHLLNMALPQMLNCYQLFFFFNYNGAEFVRVIYLYRQQRNFEQKNQYLSVLFHHFQYLISLASSPWIWWCAANLHCCKATNKNINRTFSWTSSFQNFFLEAPEQSVCCSLRNSGLFCLSLPCCTCVCVHRTQLRTGNAQRQ